MKLLHSSDLQSLNFIQNIEQQYITRAEVPCFLFQIMEQCFAYIEEYDQGGEGGALAQEKALCLSWHEMDMGWLKDGKGKKYANFQFITQHLLLSSQISIFFLRDAPHLI